MKTILLVDDNDLIRKYLKEVLQAQGAEVITASDGLSAFRLYQLFKPDCVFLDIEIPGIDGITVFRRVREKDKNAQIYFFSASTDIMNEQKAIQMGAKGFISKPTDSSIFCSIIQAL